MWFFWSVFIADSAILSLAARIQEHKNHSLLITRRTYKDSQSFPNPIFWVLSFEDFINDLKGHKKYAYCSRESKVKWNIVICLKNWKHFLLKGYFHIYNINFVLWTFFPDVMAWGVMIGTAKYSQIITKISKSLKG